MAARRISTPHAESIGNAAQHLETRASRGASLVPPPHEERMGREFPESKFAHETLEPAEAPIFSLAAPSEGGDHNARSARRLLGN